MSNLMAFFLSLGVFIVVVCGIGALVSKRFRKWLKPVNKPEDGLVVTFVFVFLVVLNTPRLLGDCINRRAA